MSPPAKKAKVDADFFKPKTAASPQKTPSPKKELSKAEVKKEKGKDEMKAVANGKPLASIFSRPAKKEEPEGEDDKPFDGDDDEGEDEISDEELEEQEEKAAVKLWVSGHGGPLTHSAAIFTKDFKSTVADKGWKEGEP